MKRLFACATCMGFALAALMFGQYGLAIYLLLIGIFVGVALKIYED